MSELEVVVRQAGVEDAEALLAHVHALAEEPDIDIPLEPGEFEVTLEQERELLKRWAASDNCAMFVAEVDGELVGNLDLRGYGRRRLRHVARLGMSVKAGWRGRGVGSRLMAAALRWAEEGGVLVRIELRVYARNAAGRALYRKFGFVEEGICRKAVFQNGEWIDDVQMAWIRGGA